MLEDLPTARDYGIKCNAQGYKVSRNGYEPHLDTACAACRPRPCSRPPRCTIAAPPSPSR
jgi:hypothetical protein